MKRWLCILLALALLCSSCAGALADGSTALSEDVLTENQSTESDIPAGEEIPVESDLDVSDEIELATSDEDSTPIEMVTQLEDTLAMEEAESEPLTAEAQATEFVLPGYVRIVESGATVYRDESLQDAIARLQADDVVLAVSISNDAVFIAMDTVRGIVEGFAAKSAFGPVEAEALNTLLNELALSGAVIGCYQDDPDYMLPKLDCAFVDAVDGQGAQSIEQTATAIDEGDPVQSETPIQESTPVEGADDEIKEQNVPVDHAAEEGTQPEGDVPTDTIPAAGEQDGGDTQPIDAASADEPKAESEIPDQGEADAQQQETGEVKDDETQPQGGATESSENEDPTQEGETESTENEDPTQEGETESTENENPTQEGETESSENEDPTQEGETESSENEDPTQEESQEETGEEEETEEQPEAVANVALTGLSLSYGALNIGLKETCYALAVRPIPAEATSTYAWYTSNARVVKVNGAGVIYGAKKGTAVITVVAANGMRASCTVKVTKAPKSIAISPASVALFTNSAPYRLPTPITSKGTSCATYFYASTNNAVATVSGAGVVTPVGRGTANINIRSFNGKWTSFRVAVYGVPAGVRFNQPSMNIYAGQCVTPGATVVDADNAPTLGTATFALAESQGEDGDADCISISGDGRTITGLKLGKAYIVARYGEFTSAEPCAINVVPSPDAIVLNRASLFIGKKETYYGLSWSPLPEGTAATVTWRTSNARVVRVNPSNGVITGVKTGTAIITAVSHNGKSASCMVKVVKAPKKIALAAGGATLYDAGQTVQIRPFVNSGAASAFTYSGGGSVASVSPSGLVTAKASGTANITVRTYNGKAAIFRITVIAPVVSVALPENFTIAEGQYAAIRATAYDAQNAVTQARLHFTFTNGTGKINVNAGNGVVAGIDDGDAVIQVSATSIRGAADETPKTATANVTIVKGPRTIAFANGRTAIGKGEVMAMGPMLLDEDNVPVNGTFSVRSSKPKIVTVSAGGVIYGRKKGKAVITYTAFNGVQASRVITVTNAPKKIAVSPTSAVLGVGQTTNLRVALNKGAAGGCSFYSSNNGVAQVNGNGVVTAVGPGVANITVQSYVKKARAMATIYVVSAPVYIRLTNVSSRVESDGSGRYDMVYWHTMKAGTNFQMYGAIEYPTRGNISSFTSSDPEVATVSPTGLITANSAGTAIITVKATGGAEVQCTLYVTGDVPEEPVMEYEPEYVAGDEGISIRFTGISNNVLVMSEGNTYKPPVVNASNEPVNAELSVDNTDVAVIQSGDTVRAVGPGTAIVTATYNGASATLQVNVTAPVSMVVLSPAEYQARRNAGGVQLIATFGSPEEKGSVTFSSSNPSVAEVNATGFVTLKAAGKATITAEANGHSATSEITVLADPMNYRLFTAYSYDATSFAGPGRLPFTRNNAAGVSTVFTNSGLGYQHITSLQNPSKSSLLNALESFVNAGGTNDVSVIYLCTHGHSSDVAGGNGYYMSLSANSGTSAEVENITSSELYDAIKGGSSRVVLILDSCYSGCFISDKRSELESVSRISVLAAAYNTRASYYNVANTSQAVDFFTFFLMMGTGYDIRGHYYIQDDKYSRGSAPGYMLADATQNHSAKDGVITLDELFDFANRSVLVNMPGYSRYSWFWGHANQSPQYFAGNNGDLVIYQPQ